MGKACSLFRALSKLTLRSFLIIECINQGFTLNLESPRVIVGIILFIRATIIRNFQGLVSVKLLWRGPYLLKVV